MSMIRNNFPSLLVSVAAFAVAASILFSTDKSTVKNESKDGLIQRVVNLETNLVPAGTIFPYSGDANSIAQNEFWQICDGAEIKDNKSPLWGMEKLHDDDNPERYNVPDLRGKCVRGFNPAENINGLLDTIGKDVYNLDHIHEIPMHGSAAHDATASGGMSIKPAPTGRNNNPSTSSADAPETNLGRVVIVPKSLNVNFIIKIK